MISLHTLLSAILPLAGIFLLIDFLLPHRFEVETIGSISRTPASLFNSHEHYTFFIGSKAFNDRCDRFYRPQEESLVLLERSAILGALISVTHGPQYLSEDRHQPENTVYHYYPLGVVALLGMALNLLAMRWPRTRLYTFLLSYLLLLVWVYGLIWGA